MKLELLHPADLIVLTMDRIYQNGMTTMSGGNLSVLDENGDIWITPSGVDKGALNRSDICRITPDGKVYGFHKPSVELPFHAAIYKCRPDLRAVLHAHPPALVAFSAVRVLPDIKLVFNSHQTLGKITMAPYAAPGTQDLCNNIADEFGKGIDVVIMENHGVVVGADDMAKAFIKFETLEFAANTEIYARKLGNPKSLTEDEINLAVSSDHLTMNDFVPDRYTPEELETRHTIIRLFRRAYNNKLFGGIQCTYSARLSDGSFVITPYGADAAFMDVSDLVLIKNNMKEQGKVPSHDVGLHRKIYERHPEICSVLGANPPHAMAFAVTDELFDTRMIPESYLMLRDIQRVLFSAIYTNYEETIAMFSAKTLILICENNRILSAGNSPLNAFDRLEVAETTAHSIIAARDIGQLAHIPDAEAALAKLT